jgi:hypothetical protein
MTIKEQIWSVEKTLLKMIEEKKEENLAEGEP